MNATENKEVAKKEANTSVAEAPKAQIGPSERFTNAVLTKFASDNGEVQITPFQKRLIQSYFVKIDQVLKMAELKRMQKSEQYRDAVAITWENLNMNKLAVDVVAYSSIGLDPTQKNHLHPIPYKNNALGKYDMQFTLGYNGIELKAKKYGIDVPTDVIIKVVYSNEVFEPKFKDAENNIESYTHKPSKNPFDKGDVVGGYYYYTYTDCPEKNKLRVFSKKDIDKRIPKTASVEFWGGEKDAYKNGKKDGKETIDGWYDEMVWKTLKRAAYDAINIDSEKIDQYIQQILENEVEPEPQLSVDDKVDLELKINANSEKLSFAEETKFEEVAEDAPATLEFETEEEQPTAPGF